MKLHASARRRLLRGADLLARTVTVTLGPRGRNVVIENPLGAPRITKDGVTVAREIELADQFANTGARLIREVAKRSSAEAGDGTTTVMVLAHAILREGVKAVAAGLDPMELKRGIDLAVDAAVADIRRRARKVATGAQLAEIATIAANGDRDLGRLLSQAIAAAGDDGAITVEEAKRLETEIEIIDGMRFARGYVSPHFITDAQKMVCELDEPYILIHEKRLTEVAALVPLLEAVLRSSRPVLIIAEEIEGEALAALVVNHLRGGLKVAAVKVPGVGYRRAAMLEDIAILTGGELAGGDAGVPLKEMSLGLLGRARRVSVGKDNTVIVGGGGKKRHIRDRVEELRTQIENTTSASDRDTLRQRLAKLTSGVAVIRVGGATELEVKERTERVLNALNASRGAVAEGFVPGGGAALLHASKALAELKPQSLGQKAGIDILRRALAAPLRQIAGNAGLDGAVVAGTLLRRKQASYGLDARSGRYVDMIEAGIIDPAMVVRIALQGAASVAGLLMTAEGVIAEKR